jgi:hypothetical protein
MNKPYHLEHLKEVCESLSKAKGQLEVSYKRCEKIDLSKSLKDDELIEYEALSSRFGRLVDMLIHKFFRALDLVELTEGGTLLDVINRAEKRGLIDHNFDARALKDLRNEIVHDYLLERFNALHKEIYDYVPKIMQICSRCQAYAHKYIKP